jgi:hypothetical protein
MKLLFKLLIFLLIAGFIALTGYAFIGDMDPERQTQSVPIQINVD